jgi:ubiquitin carboxyl-terminal hydrolase 22/27/51
MAPYTTEHKQRAKSSKKAEVYPLEQKRSLHYALSAVIVHKGGIESGHYVSYSREGEDWFLFDDSKVVLVSEAEVLSAEAYLLLYVVESAE